MIIGLFIRHYKVYQGVNYIPICDDYDNKFTSFIGDNGVGKSSTLEALNTYFNNGYWNITKSTKKSQAFIAPVFLIKKTDLLKKICSESDMVKYIEFLSTYFWSVTVEANANLSKLEYKNFFLQRDELKEKFSIDEYYLLLLGIEYDNKSKINFITFNSDLDSKIPIELIDFNKDSILEVVKGYYKYIYIPIQTSSSDILRIESKEIQNLMNSNILDDIDKILNEKKFQSEKRRNNISVIDYLNDSLNLYMDEVNKIIQKIDNNYEYKVEGAYKKNLTSNDVRKKILEAYFSIRTLKKDKKEIGELSSGEQRIAIIDIATAFLTNNLEYNEQVILAIDEPENSLHISKAFNQFERLNNLATNHQILITTHWYGSLPVTHRGFLVYLKKKLEEKFYRVKFEKFKFSNYFESRKRLPKDIMLKGYFELTSSILSCMRADKTNWIICEGTDDKIYIEHYLQGKIKNLKVFSVGGCGNVIKIFKYLYTPLSEKDESEEIDSKVLCLVDTDDNIVSLECDSQTKNKKLRIARLQIDNQYKVGLKNLDPNGNHISTEIEDCLNPEILFKAIEEVVNIQGNPEQKQVLRYYKFNEDIPVSRIKGEQSIFKLISIEGVDKKDILYNLFEDKYLKYSICMKYIQLSRELEEVAPLIFNDICAYFEENI
ncbi:ATP-binding protein [Clostridium sporogenes]|uniref:AAA family ATPase n=1 Tax=Clostridium sporogenes TaxID=1509 RepID=UPI0013D634E8|nr:AAA family ATPase [Clostridium sporogenes]NFG02909.1 ATP-binding protein [Clostridium sporogenes]